MGVDQPALLPYYILRLLPYYNGLVRIQLEAQTMMGFTAAQGRAFAQEGLLELTPSRR